MRQRALYPSLGLVFLVSFPSLVAGQSKPAAPATKPKLKNTTVSPAAAAAGIPAAADDPAAVEFFEKKIRPVLAQHCYECHSTSAGKAMGKLRLDTREAMMKGGETGAVVSPGHPETSRLIEAVTYANADLVMPPKAKLPEPVIADLKLWVKMGAPWGGVGDQTSGTGSTASAKPNAPTKKSLWSLQPVRRPNLPGVKNQAWVRTPIDQFILAKLEANHLKPSALADRRTLIRRAYYDLLGLPPTPEEIDAFVADRSPDAWEKLVDHLLASPHYGERWGRFWLDVARYGEDQAHTFEARLYPQGFRYRDWVAHALNTDMPYDRFVKEQLAADLLKEPDMVEQLPALGMFATGPVYYGDEKMFDQYDDRIDTLCRGFLGLTAACARCHDHKFDPISQKDYYGLAGIFASTTYEEVSLPAGDAAHGWGTAAALPDHRAQMDARNQALEKYLSEQEREYRTALVHRVGDCLVAAWKLHNRRKVDAKASAEPIAQAAGLPRQILERWVKYLDEGAGKNLPQLADWRKSLQQEDAKADLSAGTAREAEVRKVAEAFQLYVADLQNRRDGAGTPKPTALNKEESQALDAISGKDGALATPKDQIEKVLPPSARPRLAELKSDLEKVKSEPFVHALMDGGHIGNVHVLLRGNQKTPGDEAPRRFLAALAGQDGPLYHQGSGRLELANAIADANNPLTARVIVNRVWQHHFGTGLVKTASNFGTLGEAPSNQELLDWMASVFVAGAGDQGSAGPEAVNGSMSKRVHATPGTLPHEPIAALTSGNAGLGWSLKKLHRMIMLSSVYQQGSGEATAAGPQGPGARGQGPEVRNPNAISHNPKSAAHNPTSRNPQSAIRIPQWNDPRTVDPDDRLLWRMPVRRLEVEAWRDAMLSVSGTLDLTVGGRSVPLASADNHRRTFYAQISRHDLDPMLRMFDFPDANVTSDHRTTTTVPLQELFVLNSEFMVRQAKAFAARLTADPQEDNATRVRKAFLLAFGRAPSDRELQLGLGFLDKPAAANSTNRLTRWEEYAQVILSSNEFLYFQ